MIDSHFTQTALQVEWRLFSNDSCFQYKSIVQISIFLTSILMVNTL